MCNLNQTFRKYVNNYIIPLLPKTKFPPWLKHFFFFNTESLGFNFLLNNHFFFLVSLV